MPRFTNKVIIITGAASGIGAATAQRFASEGARLALCDLNSDHLQTFADALNLSEQRIFSRDLDVSNADLLTQFIDDVAKHFGAIDVLVNNAGIGCFGHVDEITPEAWRQTLAVDLDAVFFGSRAALPHLRKSHGCIVNTASISGL